MFSKRSVEGFSAGWSAGFPRFLDEGFEKKGFGVTVEAVMLKAIHTKLHLGVRKLGFGFLRT